MASDLNQLVLRIVVPELGSDGTVEVRPIVDGVDVVATGLPREPAESPRTLLGSDGPLVATAEPREVRLAEAECTEGCCGALYVTIRRAGEHVVWSGWRDPGDPETGLSEFRFDAKQYAAEVERASSDRSWEWRAYTVARLLQQELERQDEWFERWDCRLGGVHSYPLSRAWFTFYSPHPRQVGRDDPWLQFRMVRRVSPADPETEAAEILARLLTRDPREIAEVCGGTPEWAEQLGYRWTRW
ncbi:hypothetical protein LZ318_08210 [Saccharopolyspora indica]|uniref:hypothetical protein n=1 Tax=Saccharopolyspora indica TaxID=1229659 RepID=UPI0022EA8E06|nr:hypothetical protein [Saccharopolyspora indica]MDA3649619.1 hypothetical protein [Saccharopolyspora indica]